jgi:hypothetical protein
MLFETSAELLSDFAYLLGNVTFDYHYQRIDQFWKLGIIGFGDHLEGKIVGDHVGEIRVYLEIGNGKKYHERRHQNHRREKPGGMIQNP